MKLRATNYIFIALLTLAGALVISIVLYGQQISVLKNSSHRLEERVTSLQQDMDQLEQGQVELKGSASTALNSYQASGLAVINGYYTSIERSAWGETKKCDSFTVTGGSRDFIETMIKMVDEGNTIHSKNSSGQPVINLSIPPALRSRILNSKNNQQVEMIVSNYQDGSEGEVPACYPDVGVLLVK